MQRPIAPLHTSFVLILNLCSPPPPAFYFPGKINWPRKCEKVSFRFNLCACGVAESETTQCCMSVEYYSSDCYYGGFGELDNPSQWPQLRKKRRLVTLHPPNPRLCSARPASRFAIGPVRPPIWTRIRSAPERPCRP